MGWMGTEDAETPEPVVPAEYFSALFETFVAGVERLGPDAGVLDLGPTTSENLMFWVRRSQRVAAMDVLARHREGKDLTVGARRFGGILCWNVLCGLPADRAKKLAAELAEKLLPGGYLFAIFDGDGRQTPPALRYRIVTEARLSFERMPGTGRRAVPTSEIESLLTSLRGTRMTVMRHGAREALGQGPLPTRDPFPGARGLTGP